MNILYLSPTRFPTERAHGVQIAQMCNAFAEQGHKVTLLATSRKDNDLGDPHEYYQLPASFKVRYVAALPWSVRSKVGFWSQFLFYTIQALVAVWRTKADSVYTRDEYLAYAVSFCIGSHRIVWESHEAKYNRAAQRIFAQGIKCVAISEGIRDVYREQGVSAEQLLVAHDGIDDSFFGPRESKVEAKKRLGIKTEKPVALYIGGLDPWKGVEVFLAARAHNDQVEWVVIGGREEEVMRYREQYPLVRFLGQRPYSELKDNQQAADVLVVPNTGTNDLSAKYTSPLKLFSYLSASVPVVVSDIPSLRSVTGEGTVWYFEPDSPAALAAAVARALVESEQSATQAAAAVQLARQYTWSARARSILTFLTHS